MSVEFQITVAQIESFRALMVKNCRKLGCTCQIVLHGFDPALTSGKTVTVTPLHEEWCPYLKDNSRGDDRARIDM